MKTCRSSLSIALVLGLVLALAVAGSDPAAAKKKPKPPPQPEWVWQVKLPTTGGFNLLGEDQDEYTDQGAEDGVFAEIDTEQVAAGLMSRFGFAVFNCEPGELCHPDSGEFDQPLPILLDGFALEGYALGDDTGLPCIFPETCGNDEPPSCLECFLNGRHPDTDYRYFSLEVEVSGDYEDVEIGQPLETWGTVLITLLNTRDTLLPDGDGDFHNVEGRVQLSALDTLRITRVNESTWMVEVTVNQPMLFSEWYVGCFKKPNPKGNCPWEYKIPLDSWTTDQLSFRATWLKITQ